jgi:hypothetical protein
MILPDFVLPSRINQCWQTSGIDSIELCLDRQHFKSFPHKIEYVYNSRGFRDTEWPTSLSKLQHAIWCFGDSFTVGIGSPFEHIWPYLLQNATGTRTLNISMDGASNNWIARKALQVLEQISPAIMVIHWSYISRRETDIDTILDQQWEIFYQKVRDPSWPDCNRKDIHLLPAHIFDEIHNVHNYLDYVHGLDDRRLLHCINSTNEQDITNTIFCIEQLEQAKSNTCLVHSFIPEFVPKYLNGHIESLVKGKVIPALERLDLARDGHHYDRLTSQYFVDQILPLLKK